MKREELIKSNEFWLVQIQNKVFNLINDFRKEKKLNQTQIADHLGVTKGYVSQILSGDYDHKVSKLIDLSLSFGKAPVLNFIDIEVYIKDDKEGRNSLGNPVANNVTYVVSLSTNSFLKIDKSLQGQFGEKFEEYFSSFNTVNIPSKSDKSEISYLNYSELSEAK